jgi:hypothetical protein
MMRVEQDFELIVDWLVKNVGPIIRDDWTSLIGEGWFVQVGVDYNPKGNFVKDYWTVEISNKKKEMIFALTFC